MRKGFSFAFILLMVMMLVGCGKTLGQIREAVHATVDIGFKVFEDGQDAYKQVEGLWSGDGEETPADGEPQPEPEPEPTP